MANQIEITFGTRASKSDIEQTKQEIQNLWDWITDGWSSAWGFARDDFGKFLGDLGGDAKKTLGKGLSDSLVDGCKNGFDNLEPIWDQAWAGLLGSARQTQPCRQARQRGQLPAGPAPRSVFMPGPA